MYESLVIAFREGMEAFLIVAITLAYLTRTDRARLAVPVYYGIAAAAVASTVLGLWLQSVADNPLTEGVLAITAGIMVGTFTVHMLRAAKNIGGAIRQQIETHASKDGIWAAIGVFLFVTLMITREGMETVMMMSAAAYDQQTSSIVAGALAGLALAALMGFFWVKKSHLIHIGRFLQVSAIFLVLFSVQLIFKGIHELHELSETGIETALEEESAWGDMIAYSLVVVPMGWLLAVTLRERLARRVA